jgi:hypothetical protein
MPDGRSIIIRINPHKYKPPAGTKQKPLKERLEILRDLILDACSKTD